MTGTMHSWFGPNGGIMQTGNPLGGVAGTGYLALAAGVIGVATAAALGMMYGTEISRPGPKIFGPASDLLGGLSNLCVAGVFIRLQRAVSDSRRAIPGMAVVVVLLAAGAVSSFLLVAGVLDFVPATIAAIVALAAQALWLVAICTRLRRGGAIPPRLGRGGKAVGAGFLAGCFIVAAGLLAPAGWPQWTVFAVGGVVGLTGWVGMPVWFVLLGRHLVARCTCGRPPGPCARRAPNRVASTGCPRAAPRFRSILTGRTGPLVLVSTDGYRNRLHSVQAQLPRAGSVALKGAPGCASQDAARRPDVAGVPGGTLSACPGGVRAKRGARV